MLPSPEREERKNGWSSGVNDQLWRLARLPRRCDSGNFCSEEGKMRKLWAKEGVPAFRWNSGSISPQGGGTQKDVANELWPLDRTHQPHKRGEHGRPLGTWVLRPLGVVETKFMSLCIRSEAPPTTERTGSVRSSTERFGDGVRIARSDRKKRKITSLRKRTTEILIDFCIPCGGVFCTQCR